MVVFARAQGGLREMPVVDRIGEALRLQAEAGMRKMPLPADTGADRTQDGAGIELQAGLGGGDLHRDLAVGRYGAGRDVAGAADRRQGAEHKIDVVVERLSVLHEADRARLPEIEWSAGDADDLASRDQRRIELGGEGT